MFKSTARSYNQYEMVQYHRTREKLSLDSTLNYSQDVGRESFLYLKFATSRYLREHATSDIRSVIVSAFDVLRKSVYLFLIGLHHLLQINQRSDDLRKFNNLLISAILATSKSFPDEYSQDSLNAIYALEQGLHRNVEFFRFITDRLRLLREVLRKFYVKHEYEETENFPDYAPLVWMNLGKLSKQLSSIEITKFSKDDEVFDMLKNRCYEDSLLVSKIIGYLHPMVVHVAGFNCRNQKLDYNSLHTLKDTVYEKIPLNQENLKNFNILKSRWTYQVALCATISLRSKIKELKLNAERIQSPVETSVGLSLIAEALEKLEQARKNQREKKAEGIKELQKSFLGVLQILVIEFKEREIIQKSPPSYWVNLALFLNEAARELNISSEISDSDYLPEVKKVLQITVQSMDELFLVKRSDLLPPLLASRPIPKLRGQKILDLQFQILAALSKYFEYPVAIVLLALAIFYFLIRNSF
jgi:hypothetical protein